MENGQTSENNNETKSKPDSGSMEDTEEFRLLMAYAQRRHPNKEPTGQTQPRLVASNGSVDTNPIPPSSTKIKTEKPKKVKEKKKGKNKAVKRLQVLFRCIKPQTDEAEPPQLEARNHDDNVKDRCLVVNDDSGKGEDEMKDVAAQVIRITDEIELSPPDVEEDNTEDDVERAVALILRDSGDKLAIKFKEANINLVLLSKYDLFKRVIEVLLEKIGYRNSDPEALGPQASQKTQIAVTCEITSRLSVLDTRITNTFLSNGAQFLQDNYSPWAQQHGGYEAVFQNEDDEEID